MAKFQYPAGHVIDPESGATWSALNAVRVGIALKESHDPDCKRIYVRELCQDASAWVAAGVMDEEGARQILAAETARIRPAHTVTNAPIRKPEVHLDEFSPQTKFVEALTTFLASEMTDTDRAIFVQAFTKAARASCGMSR